MCVHVCVCVCGRTHTHTLSCTALHAVSRSWVSLWPSQILHDDVGLLGVGFSVCILGREEGGGGGGGVREKDCLA